jgi:hypothetical protein
MYATPICPQCSTEPRDPSSVAADNNWWNSLLNAVANAQNTFASVAQGGTWNSPVKGPSDIIQAPFGLSDSVATALQGESYGVGVPVVVPLNVVAEPQPVRCSLPNIGPVGDVGPWGRGPYSQPSGALGWIQSHVWAALAIAVGAGFVLHKTTKGAR